MALPPEARERLCASAVAIAKAVSYRGAGTVEFLFDEETGAYYFLEVNTRIQVEHPVTEMITGVDLVAEMFRIAGGEPLSVRQADIAVSGHAIECRINAEDPFHDFMPGPGVIGRLVVPDADGVRFDTMLYEGYGVPPFYDSLLGKLVVHGADRRDCLARLRKALAGLVIEGVPTTIPLHQALADDEAVARAAFHTRFLESWIEKRVCGTGRPPQGVCLMNPRYSFGGDEHLFVEYSEEMSLDAFFMSLSLSNGVKGRRCRCHRDLPGQRIDAGEVRSGRHRARRSS